MDLIQPQTETRRSLAGEAFIREIFGNNSWRYPKSIFGSNLMVYPFCTQISANNLTHLIRFIDATNAFDISCQAWPAVMEV